MTLLSNRLSTSLSCPQFEIFLTSFPSENTQLYISLPKFDNLNTDWTVSQHFIAPTNFGPSPLVLVCHILPKSPTTFASFSCTKYKLISHRLSHLDLYALGVQTVLLSLTTSTTSMIQVLSISFFLFTLTSDMNLTTSPSVLSQSCVPS